MSGVLIDGNLVHYESIGRGKALIFVHGWLGSWRYWVPMMEEFATDHRTYALDLWGFGDSSQRPGRYNVDSYVELLVAFMDQLGIWHTPLIGHTLGGAIATRLAAEYPDRVSKVLAAGLPLTANAINRKLLSSGPNDALARLFWHRQRPYPEVETAMSKMDENVIARTIESVSRLDLRDTMYDVDVPLLTVYGGKDNVISPAQADNLETELLAARSIVLPNARHFLMLDEPAKFSRLMRDFMDIEDPDDLQELAIKKEWRRRTR